MKSILIKRGDFFNIQDFSVFVKVFFLKDKVDEEISKIINNLFVELYLNIDQNCFARLTHNFGKNLNEEKIKKNFLKCWFRCLKFLCKEKKIRGLHLNLLKEEMNKIKDEKIKERIKYILSKNKITN